MIEKLIKVVDVNEEGKYIPYIEYKGKQPKETLEENGIPQPDGNFPLFTARMNAKTYVNDLLQDKITDRLESDIFYKLLDAAEEVKGPVSDLPELIALADMKIYDATKRFVANFIICNENMKEVVSKALKPEEWDFSEKNLIICNSLPDNSILSMVVPVDLVSWSAILVKNKEKYLLDIVNPDLIKKIYIFEKYSYFIPQDHSMYDMCYCTAQGCNKHCARKKRASGICTVSDFTAVCKDYEE